MEASSKFGRARNKHLKKMNLFPSFYAPIMALMRNESPPPESPFHALKLPRTATVEQILARWRWHRRELEEHTRFNLAHTNPDELSKAIDRTKDRALALRAELDAQVAAQAYANEKMQESVRQEVNTFVCSLESRPLTERDACLGSELRNQILPSDELLVYLYRLACGLRARHDKDQDILAQERKARLSVERELESLNTALESLHRAWMPRLSSIYEDLLLVNLRRETKTQTQPTTRDSEMMESLRKANADTQQRSAEELAAAHKEITALKLNIEEMQKERAILKQQTLLDRAMKDRMIAEIASLKSDDASVKRKCAPKPIDDDGFIKDRIAAFVREHLVSEERKCFISAKQIRDAFAKLVGHAFSDSMFYRELKALVASHHPSVVHTRSSDAKGYTGLALRKGG